MNQIYHASGIGTQNTMDILERIDPVRIGMFWMAQFGSMGSVAWPRPIRNEDDLWNRPRGPTSTTGSGAALRSLPAPCRMALTLRWCTGSLDGVSAHA